MKKWLAVLLVILFAASTTSVIAIYHLGGKNGEADCYIGVSFCGDTVAEAKLLIDRVKSYTNLFVLQSGPISKSESATNEICDYAVDAGLSIIVFFGDLTPMYLEEGLLWRLSWLNTTRQRWGDQFLGIYYYDEPGGIQVDYNWTDHNMRHWNYTNNKRDYDEIAYLFNWGFQVDQGFKVAKGGSPALFVSDYALYWWDYLNGYDVVLAQVGWNHSQAQSIALVRGAARLQGKSWGTIITWKYDEWPYLDSDKAIYKQMCTAYETGAEYIVLFNYPNLEDNDYGVMQDEHFDALERFWTKVAQNSLVVHGSVEAETALVLPRNYGWGMRHPEDKIWGLWGPDEKSPQIWSISRQLLAEYGITLDVVYEDPAFPAEGIYKTVYYWNQTIPSG